MPAEAAPGDDGVADRRQRTSAQEDAVVGDVLHLTLVHFGVAVLDHQSIASADQGQVSQRRLGTVGDVHRCRGLTAGVALGDLDLSALDHDGGRLRRPQGQPV